MKKILYIIGFICIALTLNGCKRTDYADRVDPYSSASTSIRGKHVTKNWEDGFISCVTIEGHRYIVTHISGKSAGPSGVVHAKSCQCYDK